MDCACSCLRRATTNGPRTSWPEVGPHNTLLQWVWRRPDTLVEGDVVEYALHEGTVASLFKPDRTRISQVAHFMCELVDDDATWERWAGQMPVIVDTAPPS